MEKKHTTFSQRQLEDQAKQAQKERHARHFRTEEQTRNMKNLLYGTPPADDCDQT